MEIDYGVIGERIKRARKTRNMTQEELSEKLDISIAFLSRVERGSSKINLKRLMQICSILNVSAGEILTGVSSVESNYLNSEFSDLLKKCSSDKQKLIYDIAKVIANEK